MSTRACLASAVALTSALALLACGSPAERTGASSSPIIVKPVRPIPVGGIDPPPDASADFLPAAVLEGPAPQGPTDAINSYSTRARDFVAAEACDPNNDFRSVAKHPSDPSLVFPGENWSLDALAMISFDGDCVFPDGTSQSMAARWSAVDAALSTITTRGKVLGTSLGKLPDGEDSGELDTSIKDLVPILEQYGSRLRPATYQYVLNLLATVDSGPYTTAFDEHDIYPDILGEIAAGALLPLAQAFVPVLLPPLPLLAIDVNYVAIPETENHLLLIQSTRFLANEMLNAQSPNAQYDNTQNGMKSYWLTRLSQILQHDFQEYNARPYNHYALFAIENLADYARDGDVQLAAHAVLDFAAAKYAVSTSHQRRNSPWRRRQSEYRDDYYANDMMDEMGCWFALQAGLIDFGAPADANGNYPMPVACKYMSRVAIGSYRVPPMMMEQAMMLYPTFQTFAGGTNAFHGAPGGLEIYDNEGPYLIAAGGIPNAVGNDVVIHTRVASDISISDPMGDDYPLVLPTVLLPNRTFPAGDYRNTQDISRLLRIAGGSNVPNLCVGPGFACGVNPVVPPALAAFSVTPNDPATGEPGPWTFVTFDEFYVAVFKTTLPGGANTSAGFFAAAPSVSFASFADFQARVLAANPIAASVVSGNATTDPQAVFDFTYTSPLGGVISGQYAWNMPRVYPIRELRGLPLPDQNTDNWPLASGLVSAAHDGKVSFYVNQQPWLDACVLDLSVPTYPQRTMCDLKPSDYSPPPPPPPPSLSWMHITVPPGGNTSYYFPSNAVQAGDQAELWEYVCRVTTNGVDRIGRFDRESNCWTPQPTGSIFGNLGQNYTDFDVLIYNVGGLDTFEFAPTLNGALPPSAWVAGTAENGVPIEICQVTTDDGAVYPGMVVESGCNVVVNGTTTTFSDYQVGVEVPLPPPPPPGSSSGGTGGGGGGGGGGPPGGCSKVVCAQ